MPESMIDIALEWCSRLFISDSYAYEAVRCLNSMSELKKRELQIKTNTAALKHCSLAFCLYRCCKIDGCSITISSICEVSGCSKKLVWRSVKLDGNISIAIIQPQQLLRRFTVDLHISKEEKQEVQKLCLSFSGCIGHSPKTILGYCLYIILQKSDGNKFKGGRRTLYREGQSRVTIKSICQHLDISPTCLFRFKRSIENK